LNPNVLAVIGHSRSGTTHATLPLYAAAGIPVVMPSATSPYVLYRFNERETWPTADQLRQANGSQRFTNAFRLPPSDEVQVHAIELTANELTKGLGENKPKFMLICDTTRRNGSNRSLVAGSRAIER
jgi:ABC-type branched-subunit amino acid transport system substrate-binding protein